MQILKTAKVLALAVVEAAIALNNLPKEETSSDPTPNFTRHEVARKVHEGLAGSVWRLRAGDEISDAEVLVRDVEAQALEDGDYILIVTLIPRASEEADELEKLPELPLHTFLERFIPCGPLALSDYQS